MKHCFLSWCSSEPLAMFTFIPSGILGYQMHLIKRGDGGESFICSFTADSKPLKYNTFCSNQWIMLALMYQINPEPMFMCSIWNTHFFDCPLIKHSAQEIPYFMSCAWITNLIFFHQWLRRFTFSELQHVYKSPCKPFFFFSPRVSKCFYLMLTYSEVWIWQQSPQRNWPTALFQPFLSSLHHIPPSPSLLQSKAITSDKHPLPLSFSAVSGVKQIRLDFLVLYTSVSHFLPCRLHLSTSFFAFLPVYCKPGAVIDTGLGVICIFLTL